MSAMLIAGAFAVLAGLGAIALGIPVKEFSFGNTMILSGTIGVCTGLILLGLSALLGELRVIAHRLRLRVADEAGSRATDGRSSAAERREPLSLPDIADAPGEDSRREGGFLRGRARQADLVPPLPEPEAPPRPADREAAPRPKRNLFSEVASRRDRERAEKRDSLTSDLRSPSLSEPPTLEPMQPPAFDDGWSTNKPDRDRGRGSEPPPLLRRAARPAPLFDQQDAEPPRGSDAPEVNLIKSGVVDGMAYSLYSDGSIEAQMPEGMMRFDSIAELRTHLDQRN
ncbi:MAG: hypothetical protein ABW175_14700 [Bradyrhizobium sp.]